MLCSMKEAAMHAGMTAKVGNMQAGQSVYTVRERIKSLSSQLRGRVLYAIQGPSLLETVGHLQNLRNGLGKGFFRSP